MSTLILELIGLLLYARNNNTYLDCFGVENILKEIRSFIGRSLSIKTNTFRIQAFDNAWIFLYWIY